MRNVFMLMAVVAGSATAFQAVINPRLGAALQSPFLAAFANFVVGLGCTIVLLLLTTWRMPPPGSLAATPWWAWAGGALGATFITLTVIVARPLGAALMLASVIVGQLLTALVIDHYGWFEAPVHILSPRRLLGAVLLIVGAILIRGR